VPHSLYVDNGSIYSSKEIIQICARVGCLLHHTPVRDGAAKGKIERFFRSRRRRYRRAGAGGERIVALSAARKQAANGA